MVKRNVTLHLTHEHVKVLKERGLNISNLVDAHLEALARSKLVDDPKLSKAERDLARANRQVDRLKRGRELSEKIKPFRDYYVLKTTRAPRWTAQQRTNWLWHTSENTGISVGELLTLFTEKGEKSVSGK